jgi:quinoprotein glucose dehydrogenase
METRYAAAIFAMTAVLTAVAAQAQSGSDWAFHGSNARDRFSPLTQITPANISGLKEAWRFAMPAGGLETQPIEIGGVVYTVTTDRKVAALDARTGKRIWDFQQVHHDLWDSDSISPPVLTTIIRDGKKIDVTVADNKAAYIYVLDRLTGKPIFPIVETPFPASNVPGEVAARTQPIPSLPAPLVKKMITVDDLNNSSPAVNAAAREAFANLYGNGQPFVPLGLNQNTLVIPGFSGTLGGMAADRNGILYVTAGNGAGMTKIVDNTKARTLIGEPGAPPPAGGAQNGYAHLDYSFNGYGRFGLPSGDSGLNAAATMPVMHAIDLNTGQYRWTVPLVGRNGNAGPLVTASGLLFIAAGNTLQAYTTADGKKVWETELPASSGNSAGTYMLNGKQYIVLASGGRGQAAYVAYRLP